MLLSLTRRSLQNATEYNIFEKYMTMKVSNDALNSPQRQEVPNLMSS